MPLASKIFGKHGSHIPIGTEIIKNTTAIHHTPPRPHFDLPEQAALISLICNGIMQLPPKQTRKENNSPKLPATNHIYYFWHEYCLIMKLLYPTFRSSFGRLNFNAATGNPTWPQPKPEPAANFIAPNATKPGNSSGKHHGTLSVTWTNC